MHVYRCSYGIGFHSIYLLMRACTCAFDASLCVGIYACVHMRVCGGVRMDDCVRAWIFLILAVLVKL